MEAGLSLNHFFGSSASVQGRLCQCAGDQRCRAHGGVGRHALDVDGHGAHQAHRQIRVVGQAESIEFDADLLGQVIADRVAIGKAGDIGDAAGAADRLERIAALCWAYISSAAWQSPRNSSGV
jgi:hypothetical protein